jgi:hypothetical protein
MNISLYLKNVLYGTIISNPNEIKQIYLSNMSQILQSPVSFSLKDSLHGPIEFEPPPPEKRSFIPKKRETRRGIQPHWWNKIYNRKAKEIDVHIWDPLMDPVKKEELHQTIKDLKSDLSPDKEGNDSNLMKALFSNDSDLFNIFLDLINKVLELGDIPVEWKNYYISLIEKKSGAIHIESMKDQLRPIAITHEYAKLISKILANRLNRILMENEILTPAQRAFIRNGGTHQCIYTA